MNIYLERMCGIFGNASCETSSGASLFMMIVTAAFAIIALCWIVGRVRTAFIR